MPNQKEYDELLESVQFLSLQTILAFLKKDSIPVEHRVNIAADVFMTLAKSNPNFESLREIASTIAQSMPHPAFQAGFEAVTGKKFGNG